ncbi:MAG: formylglycine-generating enzyme family protein [Phycisphaerae bacterium]|nr:formylglycine-generating enzyme family protein [Phycisphaerae bacterium]
MPERKSVVRLLARAPAVLALGVALLNGCSGRHDADPTKSKAEPETRELMLYLGDGLTMELTFLRPGTFVMGSPENEKAAGSEEKPAHKVTLSKGFYIGVHEVTQEQYAKIMGENPSGFSGEKMPVANVTWDDANEFCGRLTKKTGRTCRLPTEAEWEYACRAGTTTTWWFGDQWPKGNISDIWWFYRDSPCAVGTAKPNPNPWGLYDMHGNVAEWCSDWYDKDYYAISAGRDPKGPKRADPPSPEKGDGRVIRGSSYAGGPVSWRSGSRGSRGAPDKKNRGLGFRVVVQP